MKWICLGIKEFNLGPETSSSPSYSCHWWQLCTYTDFFQLFLPLSQSEKWTLNLPRAGEFSPGLILPHREKGGNSPSSAQALSPEVPSLFFSSLDWCSCSWIAMQLCSHNIVALGVSQAGQVWGESLSNNLICKGKMLQTTDFPVFSPRFQTFSHQFSIRSNT